MSHLLLLCACLAALSGLVALALSQERHWKSTGMTGTPPAVQLRHTGKVFLAASAVFTFVRDGVSFGMLIWPLLVGGMALLYPPILTWHPRLFRPVAKAARGLPFIR